MARHRQEKLDRRTFMRNCTMFAACGVLLDAAKGPVGAHLVNPGTAGNRDMCIGNCMEVMYQDADSCAYLVELSSGDLIIGFGPPNLDRIAFWEPPELVNGDIPSVIFHPMLPQSGRAKLENLLPHLA